MKKTAMAFLALFLLLSSGCAASEAVHGETGEEETEEQTSETEENKEMRMKIGSTQVQVAWEENEAVDALREIVKEAPLTVSMTMYGGFEQVGPLGVTLPSNDVDTETEAGDIVLYNSNMMVVFYGTNSWPYTRLGHVSDKSAEEMSELLGNGDVKITLSFE